MNVDIAALQRFFQDLQDRLRDRFVALDPAGVLVEDAWERPDARGKGGGGRTRVITGPVFERAGFGYSHVTGDSLPPSASEGRPYLAGRAFTAIGVSVVVHPLNPYVPTSHMNVRCFIAQKPGEPDAWWFGGGFDLTPYYGFEEDARAWHRAAKAACDKHDPALYPRFKRWCDDYFFIKHRQEPRGIGGIFYDDLNTESFAGADFDRCFALTRDVGQAYVDAYAAIVSKRQGTPFTDKERAFQRYRRGRYVEFNLVYDRGTIFGLQSQGRTESILMSLPPQVEWRYDWRPEPGTPEAALYEVFLPPRDWAA